MKILNPKWKLCQNKKPGKKNHRNKIILHIEYAQVKIKVLRSNTV